MSALCWRKLEGGGGRLMRSAVSQTNDELKHLQVGYLLSLGTRHNLIEEWNVFWREVGPCLKPLDPGVELRDGLPNDWAPVSFSQYVRVIANHQQRDAAGDRCARNMGCGSHIQELERQSGETPPRSLQPAIRHIPPHPIHSSISMCRPERPDGFASQHRNAVSLAGGIY